MIIDEVAGDTWEYALTEIVGSDGTPVATLSALQNWNAELVISSRPGGPIVGTFGTETAGCTRVMGEIGPEFHFTLGSTFTSTLAPGLYFMAVRLISPDQVRKTQHRYNLQVRA